MPERGRDVTEMDGTGRSSSEDSRPCYGRDGERKVRREIANCNERRRMQSINAGFQSLRKLVQGRDKDKLSKASVLQKAVEYIYALQRERSLLLARHASLMQRLQPELGRDSCDLDDESDFSSIETIKRCKMDTESSDEGIGSMPSPQRVTSESNVAVESLRKQVLELQRQLEEERRVDCLRMEKNVSASRCREKLCSSNASASTVSNRRGSLETIVEAIRCLEGDSKTSVNVGSSGVCLATANDSLVKEEYVLGDVVAAAEALQFIAARRQTSVGTASTWQRQKATLSESWRSCL